MGLESGGGGGFEPQRGRGCTTRRESPLWSAVLFCQTFRLITYGDGEGASIPEIALAPRAAMRFVIAARGCHGAVDHEQVLPWRLYREGMGVGASHWVQSGGFGNGYLTPSVV